MRKIVEILHGDFGTVRNELAQIMNEDVEEMVSLTHSTTPTQNGVFITIVLIFIPKNTES